jgi:hypothetical protein
VRGVGERVVVVQRCEQSAGGGRNVSHRFWTQHASRLPAALTLSKDGVLQGDRGLEHVQR